MFRAVSTGSTRGRLGLLGAVLLTLALCVWGLAPVRASAALPGPLHTDGGRIVTSAGRPYVIRAVAWFGMETANCAPHGLWQISLDDGLAQIASFGFNAIRLPYANECLSAKAATGVDAQKNPDLQGKTPLQIMDAVVERAAAHGLSVILDRHRPDTGSQSELWYTSRFSEQRWIDDWVMLAKRYRDQPAVIAADLHNEPHGQACWSCADPSRDWAAAATRAGDAVLAANPDWLIVVEGVEHQATAGSTWWGGGLADVAAHPVELRVPHRVVYSPHDYPASIYPQPWFGGPGYPTNLDAVWSRTWGYLAERDIAPVLLGEFGTRLQTASDRQWLQRLVGYLDERGISFAYWSFNPNSGDTGGLVADDWVTPQQAKLDALAPLLRPGAVQPSTGSSATPTPTPIPTATPAPTPSPSSSTAGGGVSWKLRSGWSGGYVADLEITAGASDRTGWSVSWPDPAATSVANAWGMTCAVAGGRVSCTGADWAATVPAGRTVTVGLQVATDGSPPVDPPLTTR